MKDRKEFQKEHDKSPQDQAREDYIRKLERMNRKLKKQLGTDELLFDHIQDQIKVYEPLDPIKYDKPKGKHGELQAALVCCDQHFEERVDFEEMEGAAEYNGTIAQSRMDQTTNKTLELTKIMRLSSLVRVLHIFSLGDWFCGKIHPQEESYGVTMPMPVAVPTVGYSFGKMLTELAPHFDEIHVTGVVGNHGRETKKPATKMTADRNWDMSVYLIAQSMTKNIENIKWNIPRSIFTVVDVMGHNCLLAHSGEVRMNNRTPYYPIENTFDVEKRQRAGTDKDFEYAFVGHWHHDALLSSYIYINPCMIGPNQFSKYKLHRSAAPQQKLFFFSENHGVTASWPINLK